MNKNFKNFLHRGFMFSGLGPIVLAVVYLILSYTISDFSLSGKEVFTAIVSIYVLAFLQAGATVFNQIESWGIAKSLLCHFSVLYVAYIVCYLLNTWIPFDPKIIAIFTLIFITVYLLVWCTVYFSVKSIEKKLNKKLH